jgi:hypothetical protein
MAKMPRESNKVASNVFKKRRNRAAKLASGQVYVNSCETIPDSPQAGRIFAGLGALIS